MISILAGATTTTTTAKKKNKRQLTKPPRHEPVEAVLLRVGAAFAGPLHGRVIPRTRSIPLSLVPL